MDAEPNDHQPAQEHGDTSPTAAADTCLVKEVCGDLFDAPEGSGLIHACNTQGSWGAGIARTFKEMYPAAYRFYRSHCQQFARTKETHKIPDLYERNMLPISERQPLGTALIIPPQAADARPGKKEQWIICLFTSQGYGTQVDPPELIINSTYAALRDLKEKLIDLRLDGTEPSPKALYSCRFNSGLFAVPWEQTKALVEDAGLRVTVVYPPGIFVDSKRASVDELIV